MNPGDRLPATTLQDAIHGRDLQLRRPEKGSIVLLLAHGAGCEPCRTYIEGMAAAAGDFRSWDGRFFAVVPDETAAVSGAVPREHGPPVSLVADPERRLARRLGLPDGSVVVADRFGEVFEVFRPSEAAAAERTDATDAPRSTEGDRPVPGEGEPHDALPDPAAITEWLRYLGTQCPECGVLDTPTHGDVTP